MKPLTLLDLGMLVHELKHFEDSKVDKVYHKGSEIVIKLFSKKIGSRFLKIKIGSHIVETEYKENNEEPTAFTMFLRKNIGGTTLREIKLVESERIVDLIFEREGKKYILIAELFAKGNVILCEPSFKILFALKRQVWSGRKIQSGKKYILPGGLFDPFRLNRHMLRDKISATLSEDIVRFVAVDLGFGGLYSEEIIARARLDKMKDPKDLDTEEFNSLNSEIREILLHIKTMRINPQVITEGELVPLPFDFVSFRDKPKKYFENYNKAVDYASMGIKKRELTEKGLVDYNKELRSAEKIFQEQEEKKKELDEKEKANREIGEIIYSHFHTLQKVIDEIQKKREDKVPWDEIKKEKFEGLESIDDKNGKFYFNIGGREIKIRIGFELTKVAEDYFGKSKRAKAKKKRLLDSIEDTNLRLEKIHKQKERKIEAIEKKLPQKRIKKKWYETFRWFYTSNNFLAISGKDAQTNETLIKKHMEPNDLVLHTDITGSPFTIIKNGKEATEKDIEDAAIQTASFSKAWKLGFGVVDVYCVEPEQVSKSAPSGGYVSKGGFMIAGKKKFIKNVKLELAIGFKEGVIIGPKDAISKHSKYVLIKPGYLKRKEAAQKIKNKLDKLTNELVDEEEIMSRLPSGNIKIEK